MREYTRPSTFHYWINEESGQVKNIPLEKFLEENPGYTNEYTTVFNVVRSVGCVYKDGQWYDPSGRGYENIYECHDRYAVKKFQ